LQCECNAIAIRLQSDCNATANIPKAERLQSKITE
jgi:hypothetical protein